MSANGTGSVSTSYCAWYSPARASPFAPG
jgi:hypothetical protein